MSKLTKPYFVQCHGTPRERGRIHGESLREVIQETIERWQTKLIEKVGMPYAQYQEHLLRETSFRTAIERWTPDLLEEVRGIGEGAGLDFELIFAWQLLDEHGWFSDLLIAGPGKPEEKCSGFGYWNDVSTGSVMGQNLDLPVIKDGAQTVLQIKYENSDLELIVATQAGALASLGLNNRALGVCVNTISQLDTSVKGLPVVYVIRGLLEKASREAAMEFARSISHASGQNYIMGSPLGVEDLECSAHKVVPYQPAAPGKAVYHSNHPLVNDDQEAFRARKKAEAWKDPEVEHTNTSSSRWALLQKEVEAWWGSDAKIGVEEGKRLLRTSPVCIPLQENRDSFSALSAVMELNDTPRIHIAAGPPDETPFHTFGFRL